MARLIRNHIHLRSIDVRHGVLTFNTQRKIDFQAQTQGLKFDLLPNSSSVNGQYIKLTDFSLETLNIFKCVCGGGRGGGL